MKNTKIGELNIVGVSTRTSNEPGKAERDIPQLWQKFMSENLGTKVSAKVNETIYAVYSDYEGDHTQPYTLTIGYNVSHLDNIPEELTVKIVPPANYAKFISKGDLTKDAVINTWMEIWNTELNRSYTMDLEIYDDRAMNPTNGIAEILVALK